MNNSPKETNPNISDFSFYIIPKKKIFHELLCSFWDTENIINKKYKSKSEKIPPKNTKLLEDLEGSYFTLSNQDFKKKYLTRLYFQYISSQPNSLIQLLNKYNSIVYPYFLFLLNSPDYYYVVLNFIDFTLELYSEKSEPIRSIEIASITKIQKEENSILLMIPEEKNNIIILPPEIVQQVSLLYILIMFMGKFYEAKNSAKSQTTIVQEINQNLEYKSHETITKEKIQLEEKIDISNLKLLENDLFIPKGIKSYSNVYLDKVKKPGEYDRFITVGNSFLLIFKDESMSSIMKIIPIFSTYVIFDFRDESINLIVKIKDEDISFIFPEAGPYNIIKQLIDDLKEEKNEEEIKNEDLEKICFEQITQDKKISEKDVISSLVYQKTIKQIDEINMKIQALLNMREILQNIEKETKTK